MEQKETSRLLRLEEVAYRLGISYQYARMLVLWENAMPHVKVGSRGVRVKEEDLNKYIAKIEQEKKKEETEKQSGSSNDASRQGTKDTREPYEGSGTLLPVIGGDKPARVKQEDSKGSPAREIQGDATQSI